MYYKIVGRLCLQIVCLAALLTAAIPAGSQTRQEKPRAQRIELIVKVLNEDYCLANNQVRSLVLRLNLQLINGSGAPITAFTPLSGVTIISDSLADAILGKHEMEMHPPDASIRAPKVKIKSNSEQRLIKPGESIESVSDQIQLFIRVQPQPDLVSLRPGTHYLQFQTDVFPPNAKVSDLISVVKRITSDPIPISIQENSVVIPSCSALFESLKSKGQAIKKPTTKPI